MVDDIGSPRERGQSGRRGRLVGPSRREKP